MVSLASFTHHSAMPQHGGTPQHGGHRRWAAELSGRDPRDIVDFSASLNPLGPPQSVLDALQAAIADPLTAIGSYPDPDAQALRLSLAEHHQIPMDWIQVGNGAAEWITWAARASAALDQTLLPVPAFADYGRALRSVGATIKPIRIPLEQEQGWHLEPWLMQKTHSTSPQALWINNPHNPTGILWPIEEILELLPHFELVVADEAFMDFVNPIEPSSHSLIPWIPTHPQVVVIRSLTKFYTIPGLRLGYVIAHPDRLQQWHQWRDPWTVNGLALAAGVAALQDRAFQSQTHQWLAPARKHLISGLQTQLGWDPLPSAANFVLCNISGSKIPGSAQQLQAEWLQHKGILIRECSTFAELGSGYIRLAVRTPPDHQRLWAINNFGPQQLGVAAQNQT